MNPVSTSHSVMELQKIREKLMRAGRTVNSPIWTFDGPVPNSDRNQANKLAKNQPAFLPYTWLVNDTTGPATNIIKVPAVGKFGDGVVQIAGLSAAGAVDNTTYPRTLYPALFESRDNIVYAMTIKGYTPGVTPIPAAGLAESYYKMRFNGEQLATPFRGVDQVIDLTNNPAGAFSPVGINWGLGIVFVVLVDF
jgi:hypothetical protein